MLRTFATNRSGNFGMIAALLSIPLFGAAALAVDYINASGHRSNIQNAVDAAVLAAASSGKSTEGDLRAVAEKVLLANVDSDLREGLDITGFAVNADGKVTMSVSGKLSGTFARIFKVNVLEVAVRAQAQRPGGQSVEIALVLDNTYSMVGQKLSDLKNATNALIKTFETEQDLDVKIAVVPFSRYVNVGTQYRNASWLDVDPDSSNTRNVCYKRKPVTGKSGCRTETTTGMNDGVPTTGTREVCTSYAYGPEETVCEDRTTHTRWYGCVGSRNAPLDISDTRPDRRIPGLMNQRCSAPLLTLTDNFTAIRKAVSEMKAQYDTYIPAGIMWGWRVLSPQAPFSEGKTYSKGVRKFMIVMTDGANTLSPSYPHHNGKDGTYADRLMTRACENAKAEGIEIFTVGVDVPNASTREGLVACASQAKNAIAISDSTRLGEVFQNIAGEILSVRLTM
ncbi:Flp pilus assembly protein TadG [Hoeflea halophila]|uniref:Flp pilus assembly protein TadG n=1 Tax=Hoeflea halophila TaxID=714899 RepID=A0A286HKS3_9HYPH|nr:VWA domain-containing protein [Hoeflea halophila]SOE08378.1 Flp pilus assembly protein TadG [Hoeflea halophila]